MIWNNIDFLLFLLYYIGMFFGESRYFMEKEKNSSKLDDYNIFLEASNNINDRINDLNYNV